MPTTSRGIPYPGPGDPNNVPADLFALADWLDDNFPASGIYTPTFSAISNMTGLAASSPFLWSRVGDVVSVSGRFAANSTSSGGSLSARLDVPVPSTLPSGAAAAGVAAVSASGSSGVVTGTVGGGLIGLTLFNVAPGAFSGAMTFQYRVT